MLKKIAISALTCMLPFPAFAGELSEKEHCQNGDIRCVHFVLQAMDKEMRKLAKDCDHDAIFALVYLRTTEAYEDTAEILPYEDVTRVTREDALFADYYFRAYDAYHDGDGVVPPAWQIAFDAAEAGAVTSVGNAVLGINAHIQRDLPFVLYELHTQGLAPSYHDHNVANTFLAMVEVADEIIARFDPTYPPDVEDPPGPSLTEIWREVAWQNFVRLRDAPDDAARAAVAFEIESTAAATAAGIAFFTAYPPGTDSSARDAYCEDNG